MTDKHFYITVGVILVGGYFLGRKVSAAAVDGLGTVVGAVDITSDTNLLYKGLSAVGDVFDDGEDNGSWSPGSGAFDLVEWFKGLGNEAD